MKVSLFLFIISCSSLKDTYIRDYKKKYVYTDTSGEYIVERKFKTLKNELITGSILRIPGKKSILEKTVAVSKKKISSNGIILLPKVSEHKVWFSKKLYYSKIEAQIKEKRYKVTMRSPEKKWRGIKYFPVPNGKKICWFSQMAECLKTLGLLEHNKSKKEFLVIWDSFPYYIEQLTGIDNAELFSRATINYDSNFKHFERFEVNINNNSLFYFFNKNGEFKRYFWIAQGLSMIEKE